MGNEVDIRRYRAFRRHDYEINDFEHYVTDFWEYFIKQIPDIDAFFSNEYVWEVRGNSGGNMLFRPRGLCPFIDAISTICMNEENTSYKQVVDFFADFEIIFYNIIFIFFINKELQIIKYMIKY